MSLSNVSNSQILIVAKCLLLPTLNVVCNSIHDISPLLTSRIFMLVCCETPSIALIFKLFRSAIITQIFKNRSLGNFIKFAKIFPPHYARLNNFVRAYHVLFDKKQILFYKNREILMSFITFLFTK